MPRGIAYGPGMFFSGQGTQTGLKAKWWNPSSGINSYTWTVPESGLWKFYAWGYGSMGAVFDYREGGGAIYFAGGASGGLGIITKYLNAGQTVAVQLPSDGNLSNLVKLTFPDGTIAQIPRAATPVETGGPPTNAVGGIPTGFDQNINGSNGVTGAANGLNGGGTDGGAGAPTGSGVPGGAGAPGADGLKGGDGARYGQSPGFPGGGSTYASGTIGSVNNTGFVFASKVG